MTVQYKSLFFIGMLILIFPQLQAKTTIESSLPAAIGAIRDGGLIACTKSTGGLKNLIVSEMDNAGGVLWSNIKYRAVGSKAQSDSNGLANSNAIIAQKGHRNSAAKVCRNLKIGGFTDWYLPSKNELACLANNRKIIGEYAFEYDGYWSSTESRKKSARHAWYQHFANGYQGILKKTGEGGQIVRCIRAFKA